MCKDEGRMWIWIVFASTLSTAAPAPEQTPELSPPQPLPINRRWDVLKRPRNETQQREALADAAARLNPEHSLMVAGINVTPEFLREMASTPPEEPLLRAIRERTKRAIDLVDFLLLLDDVLATREDVRARGLWVAGGRARSEGILIHPDDVFKKRPRRYASRRRELAVDKPARPAELDPAADGDILGPNWSARFENPSNREGLIAALNAEAPEFRERVMSLLTQLEAQGAEVYLTSTVRKKERGYLMWGAFYLSRAEDDATLTARRKELEKLNRQWKLNIPIQWQHPKGPRETREAARLMAEAYDVVYATKGGACCSDHYDGSAVDFIAIGLPRSLTLTAPDGATKTFDLSHPSQPRDISLTPKLIRWVETHFQFRKLVSDYPHWNDVKDR